MNLLGLSFMIFRHIQESFRHIIISVIHIKGFLYQLRVTDKPTFLRAIIVERIRKKVEKCKLDIFTQDLQKSNASRK